MPLVELLFVIIKLSYETAKEINNKFFEVVVAKDFDAKALSILKKKKI